MCRLMVYSKDSFDSFKKFFTALKELEVSQGGDGNGVALSINGRITGFRGVPEERGKYRCSRDSRKGPFVPIEQIASWAWSRRSDMEFGVFHTRLASAGVVDEANCQPFRSPRSFMAHNGHMAQEISLAARVMGHRIQEDMSDSRLLHSMIGHRSLKRQVHFIDRVLRPRSEVLILGTPRKLAILAYKRFYFSPTRALFSSEPLWDHADDWYSFEDTTQVFDRGEWRFPEGTRQHKTVTYAGQYGGAMYSSRSSDYDEFGWPLSHYPEYRGVHDTSIPTSYKLIKGGSEDEDA